MLIEDKNTTLETLTSVLSVVGITIEFKPLIVNKDFL